jgi:hypothetical protein
MYIYTYIHIWVNYIIHEPPNYKIIHMWVNYNIIHWLTININITYPGNL